MNSTVANPNKALWEKGDFTEIAALMRQSGEELVKSPGRRRVEPASYRGSSRTPATASACAGPRLSCII